jgi:nitroimidazol reductase NimA-like FMN-containing flavoprotein (pyridoxamine 5'-phosphate oxidase superfamily)
MRIIDDRTGLEVLTRDECLRLLQTHHIGRVGVVAAHRPLIFPVNYVVDGDTIVFRTDEGMKLFGSTESGYVTAFEIDGTDPVYQAGWSVVVNGRAREVVNPQEIVHLSKLPLRPWAPGEKTHWVRIRPNTITGRRIITLG